MTTDHPVPRFDLAPRHAETPQSTYFVFPDDQNHPDAMCGGHVLLRMDRTGAIAVTRVVVATEEEPAAHAVVQIRRAVLARVGYRLPVADNGGREAGTRNPQGMASAALPADCEPLTAQCNRRSTRCY